MTLRVRALLVQAWGPGSPASSKKLPVVPCPWTCNARVMENLVNLVGWRSVPAAVRHASECVCECFQKDWKWGKEYEVGEQKYEETFKIIIDLSKRLSGNRANAWWCWGGARDNQLPKVFLWPPQTLCASCAPVPGHCHTHTSNTSNKRLVGI